MKLACNHKSFYIKFASNYYWSQKKKKAVNLYQKKKDGIKKITLYMGEQNSKYKFKENIL